jgi:hypothetical protein
MSDRVQIQMVFALVFLIIFSGCSTQSGSSGNSKIVGHENLNADSISASTLSKIRQLDVYFEHASVGGNIMGGLQTLSDSNPGRYSFNGNSSPDALWYQTNSGFGDNNRGNPGLQEKIAYFYNSMNNNSFATNLDVAMFKFCFIDTEGTAEEAFESNMAVLTTLEVYYPQTEFVWWTMPLEITGSARRDDFNNLVRSYCNSHNQYLIDIADIECHNPAGIKQTDGGYEKLYSAYAGDTSGHLNTAGSLQVAKAWWVMMGRIAEK